MNVNIIKIVVGFVASAGVGTVVGNAVKATSPAITTPLSKALIAVGSVVAVSMAGAAAAKHTDEEIDKVVEWYENN